MKTEQTMKSIEPMSQDILATSQDLNAILATGGVKNNFFTHYVNAAKQEAGIEQLIRSIMTEHGAIFPRGSHLSEMRAVVIGGSMFLEEIESKIREAFGSERYPQITIRVMLTREMREEACIVKLSKAEDATAKTRPRRKYYLAE